MAIDLKDFYRGKAVFEHDLEGIKMKWIDSKLMDLHFRFEDDDDIKKLDSITKDLKFNRIESYNYNIFERGTKQTNRRKDRRYRLLFTYQEGDQDLKNAGDKLVNAFDDPKLAQRVLISPVLVPEGMTRQTKQEDYYTVVPDRLLIHFNKGDKRADKKSEANRKFQSLMAEMGLERENFLSNRISAYDVYKIAPSNPFTLDELVEAREKILGSFSDLKAVRYDNIPVYPQVAVAGIDETKIKTWYYQEIEMDQRDSWKVGSEKTRVAIIDFGVATGHEALINLPSDQDLANNSRENPVIQNLIADFGGGFDTNDLEHRHGTPVMGIIGMNRPNDPHQGIHPDADLLSLNISDDNSDAGIAAIVEDLSGVVDVINMSLTGNALSHREPGHNRLNFEEAFEKASQSKTIVAVAAGNQGHPNPDLTIFTELPGVVVVGAIDDQMKRRFNSGHQAENESPKLAVVAPGDFILTTDIPFTDGFVREAGDSIESTGNYWGYYGSFSNTSAATPFVSGLFAAMYSHIPEENRDLATKNSLIEIVKLTAKKLEGYTFVDVGDNKTWNNEVGHGLIQVKQALELTEKLVNGTPVEDPGPSEPTDPAEDPQEEETPLGSTNEGNEIPGGSSSWPGCLMFGLGVLIGLEEILRWAVFA